MHTVLFKPAHAWQAWSMALRPASLVLAIGPVWVGAAVAFFHTGELPIGLTAMALLAALLMQAITNLQNDVGFTARGCAEVGQHVGLPRATAQGWISVRRVRWVLGVLCAVATSLGLVLVTQRGWVVLAIGVASLLAALAYMGGPKPIAYTPWGELTVWVFFGWVAVLGTEWLLSNQVTVLGACAAAAVGSVSAAALAVNNHRDMTHDRLVGRHTLAVWLGAAASARMLHLWLLLPFVMCGVMWAITQRAGLLLPLMGLPHAMRLMRRLPRCTSGADFNALLFGVFRTELAYATALSGALVGVKLLSA
ncbi:1,4-dihydroxy-2-naphthoate octaprenyltransferase [Limnohabitans sp. JirII-29]|uniref:1,4-dihydroxy-2-naphthoate octaprenyltransferase n=1 Tax=Limnohabitans sp. JirII-29 TaxID=1835756 RepID=UPI001E4397F5|nr:1,4-dihydroxy-2-naphthoate octaprenyltransferase [Limnohabitans sp. JirII-29]